MNIESDAAKLWFDPKREQYRLFSNNGEEIPFVTALEIVSNHEGFNYAKLTLSANIVNEMPRPIGGANIGPGETKPDE